MQIDRTAAIEAAMARPEYDAAPEGTHVYRLGLVDTHTPIAVPATKEDAAMAFRCPVLRCRIGQGAQCAQRWAVAQAGAMEREKCRVCPAGRARARLLGFKAEGVDMITADRMRIVTYGGQTGDREKEVKRVTRLREAQKARSEVTKRNREARVATIAEQIAEDLAGNPAGSATELCRRLLGPTATSTEQSIVSDALRVLIAANRVARGTDRRYHVLSKGEVQ